MASLNDSLAVWLAPGVGWWRTVHHRWLCIVHAEYFCPLARASQVLVISSLLANELPRPAPHRPSVPAARIGPISLAYNHSAVHQQGGVSPRVSEIRRRECERQRPWRLPAGFGQGTMGGWIGSSREPYRGSWMKGISECAAVLGLLRGAPGLRIGSAAGRVAAGGAAGGAGHSGATPCS